MLPTVAAVFLGGTSIFGGRGTIFGTFVAAFAYRRIEPGIVLLGRAGFYTQVIYRAAILGCADRAVGGQRTGVPFDARRLGKTGRAGSEVGFGAWAVGGDWGAPDDEQSLAAMHAAVDAGVTFFDTATSTATATPSAWSGGYSASGPSRLSSRRGRPSRAAGDRELNVRQLCPWLERSLGNLGVDIVGHAARLPPRRSIGSKEALPETGRAAGAPALVTTGHAGTDAGSTSPAPSTAVETSPSCASRADRRTSD